MRRWRRWAFESAALDLALQQAGRPLHEVLGREPRPLGFVNSLGLGDPPTFDPIRRRLELHPGLRFKLDVTPAWTPGLIEEVAATGAVEIVDFKGHYGLELGELTELLAMYERVIAALPRGAARGRARPAGGDGAARGRGAPHLLRRPDPRGGRSRRDAAPAARRQHQALPRRRRCARCSRSTRRSSGARPDHVRAAGWASSTSAAARSSCSPRFPPDGPNDIAPSGYNLEAPAADLPPSPLPADPAPTGFRRA